MADVEPVFVEIEHRLITKPENIAGYTAHYLFVFDHKDEYHLSITNGEFEIGAGPINNAQLTISMSSNDFVGLAQGLFDAATIEQAVHDQRIKIAGDLSLAELLPGFFKDD